MILHIESDVGSVRMNVSDYLEASKAVRTFIEKHELGAGCGTAMAFHKATITDNRKEIAKISYNGRVWNMDGSEIVC